tara:strand:- start:151 stop:312 length:162 start_codon:yes stop_codon:yes gene_type:complete
MAKFRSIEVTEAKKLNKERIDTSISDRDAAIAIILLVLFSSALEVAILPPNAH